LDETHIFISADVLDMRQDRIDELMAKVAVPPTDGREALK
jgi:hypothetical protein